MITETPEIAGVLDRAAARWPQVPRGQLIPRLLLEADRALSAAEAAAREADRERLRSLLAAPDPRLRGVGGAETLRSMRETDRTS